MNRDIAADPRPTLADRTAEGLQVRVRAPGRLHLGFVDPDGTLGRRFGSLGLVLQSPATELTLARRPASAGDMLRLAPGLEAAEGASEDLARLARHLETVRRHTHWQDPLALTVHELLPAHAGMGSGTQLALALGHAFARLHGWAVSTPELAALLGRAERSGIGVAGFDRGGVLLDAGRRARPRHPLAADVAPLIARFDLPAAWRVLLVRDDRARGLHGDDERAAIRTLPRFPQERAAHLSHLLLMRMLPALAELDFEPFAQGVSEMQHIVGEHFAAAQGGLYTSPAVARLVQHLGARHGAGIGQSSWGPTGFALFPGEAEAQAALTEARAQGLVDAVLRVDCVAGCNRGATVALEPIAGATAGGTPTAPVSVTPSSAHAALSAAAERSG